MPTTTILNAKFDGINDVIRPDGGTASFNSKFMGYYSAYNDKADDLLKADVKLTGADWTVKTMRFSAAFDNLTIMKDLNGNSGRRIDYLELGKNSDVDLISTRVKFIVGWDGDKHDVNLGGKQTGSTSAVQLNARENVVTTGSAWVHTIDTGWYGPGKAAGDTITIGKGGANIISTGQGNDKVTTGTGWVEAIGTRDGNDIVKIGSGNAALVRTGDGKDIVNASSGWVEMISTGDDRDIVTLGKKGAAAVRLGDGNDTIKVRDLADGKNGIHINGGSGTDTLDFGGFSKGVRFSLDEQGAYQNVAAANPNSTKSLSGWFAATSVENLLGTKKSDTLSGDAGANKLIGRGGNDKISGEGGNDTLIGGGGADVLDGGKGNDMLRGNAGADVFVFGAKSGKDTVKDYQDGTDILRLDGHTGGFADLKISKQAGDKVIVHDGGIIVLDGKAGVTLTASDFDFV